MNAKQRGRKRPDDVIATRRLRDEDGHRYFTVWIGRPRKMGRDWQCPYHIGLSPESGVEAARGVDAFQALIHALEAIRIRLEQRRGTFTWRGGEAGDAGFPRYVPAVFGQEFAKSINRLIDNKLMRFSEKAEKSYGSVEPKAARKRSVTG